MNGTSTRGRKQSHCRGLMTASGAVLHPATAAYRSGPVMLLPRLRRGRSTVRWIENLTPIAIVMHDPCSGFRLLALVLGLIVSLASAVGAAPAVPAYTITELGTFGGTSSEASRVGAVWSAGGPAAS